MEKHLPIYRAVVDMEDESGIYAVSLVDYPAIEENFLAFAKQDMAMDFKVQDEEKHLLFGPVMKANSPIYRIGPSGFEFYVVYEPETIRLMAEKYLKVGFQNNVDAMHDKNLIDGIDMVQLFVKDSAKGIDPKDFPNVADGSLFAEYHILNEDIWAEVKAGTYKGFSLAGYFGIEPVEKQKEEKDEYEAMYESIVKKMNELK